VALRMLSRASLWHSRAKPVRIYVHLAAASGGPWVSLGKSSWHGAGSSQTIRLAFAGPHMGVSLFSMLI